MTYGSRKMLLEQESTKKGSSNGDPQSEGDEKNCDGDRLVEDCFLAPPDEEEIERWDALDEQGDGFEQALKHAAKQSRKHKGKTKKALRLPRPATFRKKIHRKLRDEEFLGGH
jgi:hypothetical protein